VASRIDVLIGIEASSRSGKASRSPRTSEKALRLGLNHPMGHSSSTEAEPRSGAIFSDYRGSFLRQKGSTRGLLLNQ
jgi:hypothetical protein